MSEATKEITIQGLTFEVSSPYAEGHVCTEAEAKALNQTRHENVRNNMARVIKAEKGEAEEVTKAQYEKLAAAVAEYDADYVFTLASVGGGRKSKDPIEIEAAKIARAAIVGKLKAEGRKVSDVDKDTMAAAVATLAASEAVVKAATKAVKERSAIAEGALSELDI